MAPLLLIRPQFLGIRSIGGKQPPWDENIPTACINEAAGRRIARLSGLGVTGSTGVLLGARAVRLSDRADEFALREVVGEAPETEDCRLGSGYDAGRRRA